MGGRRRNWLVSDPAGAGELRLVELLRPRALFLRGDVLAYGIVAGACTSAWGLLWLVPVTLVLVLVELFSLWFVAVRARVGFRRVASLEKATSVLVRPLDPHLGRPMLLELTRGMGPHIAPHFIYQRSKYFFDETADGFSAPRYPVGMPLRSYIEDATRIANGLTPGAIVDATERFGANSLDMSLQSFREMFVQQATAPFFVFQVFCVLLWCLDGKAFFSLVTLALLVLFEANVVKARLKNLRLIRSMSPPPCRVRVRRGGRWGWLPSRSVVPGDVVCVSRNLPVDRNSNAGGPESVDRSEAPWPCDTLIIWGNAVVNEALLTGESVPQLKDALSLAPDAPESPLSLEGGAYKQYVVFAGTQVLMTTQGSTDGLLQFPAVSSSCGEEERRLVAVGKVPDGGALGVVLRTGFGTAQGSLFRTIAYAPERATANSWEALAFIAVLLVFGVAAAAYVVAHGLQDAAISGWRLALEAALIITCVVPPELPMELSMAVNASMIELAKLKIFCTEPFRIPFAGKVDVCCFDKTGTITSDSLYLRALVVESEPGTNDVPKLLPPGPNVPDRLQCAVGGCHSLAFVDGQVLGDPIEAAALQALRWMILSADVVSQGGGAGRRIRVLHRYRFSSQLRRMATLCALDHRPVGSPILAVVKGAAEAMLPLLLRPPGNFDALHRALTSSGARVLAVATKELPNAPVGQLRAIPREQIENALEFAGFLVFDSPPKRDSADALAVLRDSAHDLKVLTGDNSLTACAVASDVRVSDLPAAILSCERQYGSEGGEGKAECFGEPEAACWQWRSPAGAFVAPYYPDSGRAATTKRKLHEHTRELARKHMLCVEGSAVQHGILDGTMFKWITVFARATPEQKAAVASGLRREGCVVLVCGDGTNDVGALKRAHVGVAIVSETGREDETETEAEHREAKERKVKEREAARAEAAAAKRRQRAPKRLGVRARLELAQKQIEEARAKAAEAEDVEVVRLGDASIAAPFTSKRSSLHGVPHLLRWGRCSLVVTVEMYKILALNCLVTAYALSVLFLDGVKTGDLQGTFASLVIAGCFLFIAKTSPASGLSAVRPPGSVFRAAPLVSIFLQAVIHLACLLGSVKLARDFDFEAAGVQRAPLSESLVSKFEPSLTNTVVFLISLAIQITTFFVNYPGAPFMIPLRKNRPLTKSLIFAGVATAVCTMELLPPLNRHLQLVSLPLMLRSELMGLILADLGVAWAAELAIRWLLERPSKVSTCPS